MRIRIRCIRRGACILALALLSSQTALGNVLCVSQDLVSLRGSPGSSYVVLEAPRNYPLQVLETDGNYVRVSDYLDRSGWVEASAISPSRCGVVERNEVNLRTGPGTDHEVVARAREGVALQILGSQGNWLRVRQGGRAEAWIYSPLVWGTFE